MANPRQCGILLHPTALPSPHRCGDLGDSARAFVDFLAASGQRLWQVLPLNPPGYGDSPYSALSAFAGDLRLVSLEMLVEAGDLSPGDLPDGSGAEAPPLHLKRAFLRQAAARFTLTATPRRREAYDAFCRDAAWLDDYVLFVALHEQYGGNPWLDWPEEIRRREPASLAEWRQRLSATLEAERYAQFVFFAQWQELRTYARERGVALFGDIPIFVSLDSADVWSRPELFRLDADLRPTVVAGVPPDYFSATGQRWGNPLYRWDDMASDNFAWWRARLGWNLGLFDVLRIDHFRGLEACWSIPADQPTAMHGHWENVPGRELLQAFFSEHPAARLVAEDLGVITPEVEALRREFALPGMKILQFAFDSGPDNPYLPHNLETDSVIYTGTHDNDTTLGWWRALESRGKQRVRDYLGHPCRDMPWDLIRAALASTAATCILPAQDLLGLGSEARFNRPGQATGNWSWRIPEGAITPELAARLGEWTARYGR